MANHELQVERTTVAGQRTREREYWLQQLAGQWQKTRIYYDFPGHKTPGERASYSFLCAEENADWLLRLSNNSDQRLFMILAAEWVLLLYKYTGSTDILCGTPIYKQEQEGDFINTLLPLRFTFATKMTFKELLLQTRQLLAAAAEHQNYPMEALLHKLDLPVPSSAEDEFPLCEVALLLDNVHDQEYLKPYYFSICLAFHKTASGIGAHIDYDASRYHATTMAALAEHFEYLTSQLKNLLDAPLETIDILTETEKKKLLLEFNNTTGYYPEEKTIHWLFEEQVETTPDKIAVSFPELATSGVEFSLSYRQLNERSNGLAHELRRVGVGPDAIVALSVTRSLEMVVCLLGILKAGGAYMPIDHNYPLERKNYMLTDSRVSWLLTDETTPTKDHLPATNPGLTIIPIHREADFFQGVYPNPDRINTPQDLVYLIYTSGSTGQPKGVMLEHQNVVNLVHFDLHQTNLDVSKILQFHTIGFDVSFCELFLPLLSGGEVVLIQEDSRMDLPQLFQVVRMNHIPTLFLPMSFLRIIFNDPASILIFPGCVRHILTAGEQVVINRLFRDYLSAKGVYLHNHYGPAETHVVTTETIAPTGTIPQLPPIGKPILNTYIYILDSQQRLLPIGVPGELVIGGKQVGRGYLHRPELTAERFITPASIVSLGVSERFYRTGDLARWTHEGVLEFLGRMDAQVKIRGFRIEPGEIESRLLDIPTIQEAVVIDRTDEHGEKYLCAFFVSSQQVNTSEIREILATTLPDYMVPAYFLQIPQIPLSPHGKVKRDALPDIRSDIQHTSRTAPRDDWEKQLHTLWAEVLNLSPTGFGIDDHFFQLGGHSLKATILMAKIARVFSVKLVLGDLFSNPTIRTLAVLIKQAAPAPQRAIEKAAVNDYYPLSSAQKRMYILHQLDKTSLSYNMPAPLVITGPVLASKFATAFTRLIERQEGLRTRFVVVAGQPVQQIVPEVPFTLTYQEHENAALPALIKAFVQPFDLTQAPLFRAGLMRLAFEKHLLMVDLHHIIGDGVSLGVMIQEFSSLYQNQELPPMTIQYKDYAVWQQQLIQSGRMQEQMHYWLKELDENIPPLAFPLDFPRPAKMSFEGQWVDFEIDSETTQLMKQIAKQHEATLYMVLLAGYTVLLHKYTGQEIIVVGSAIAGRTHPDLEHIIGVFLNTLAIKTKPAGQLRFLDFLAQVRHKALAAYDNQDCQFEELVEQLDIKREPGRNALFDTMLNFINMDIPHLQLDDLHLSPYPLDINAVKLDMKINAREQEGKLLCTLDYSSKLFKPSTMAFFLENFRHVLAAVTRQPAMLIADVHLLATGGEEDMMADFNEELNDEF